MDIERIKDGVIQHDMELVVKKIPKELITEIVEQLPTTVNHQLLNTTFDTIEKIKTLKAIRKEIKPHLKKWVRIELKEAYREIKEDHQWVNTKEGALVYSLSKWCINFRTLIADKPELSDITIGPNQMDPSELIVVGYVADRNIEKKLKGFIENKKPPVEPQYHIAFR